ncbi:transposase [Sorangium sp. So ce136]|uniref:transposase n=1 Tax=Sorangium sp. So ce136 TaxID=3133284 RepID=UPI003F52236D
MHLVLDNLNTHTPASLIKAFGTERGRALAARFAFHHTPKHASWLNAAEIEASLVSRKCLGRNRIPTFAELRRRDGPARSAVSSTRPSDGAGGPAHSGPPRRNGGLHIPQEQQSASSRR